MKIMLTGAFGNIGSFTLEELIAHGHQVRAFDILSKTTEKTSQRFRNQAEIQWGDLRNLEDMRTAVRDQEAVIHLGFVIPQLSVTGVRSEDAPDFARGVNVGGTKNLVQAILEQPDRPRLIFASSLHVFGRTQDQPPPRIVSDPVSPVEHYAQHKVECEQIIRQSELVWSIFRLPATLPVRLIMDKGMFDVPLNNRIEYGHGRDVATAFANGVVHPEIWGKTLLIGGGPRCQFYYRDLVGRIMDTVGIGRLPDKAFSEVPFSTDWMDTRESQRLLKYQQRSLDDYLKDIRSLAGWRLPFIQAFRPFIRSWLLSLSPYWRKSPALP